MNRMPLRDEAAPADSILSRRILAVFNPVAGRGRRARFERVIAHLRRLGVSVTVAETAMPGHAAEIVRGADDAQFDLVAAAGGDGTINEVVNGLKGKRLALGVIPLGTANVLADEIGLKRSPAVIARALAFGPLKPVHVGVANGRRFTMMAGAGFDATVAAAVTWTLKKRLGWFAYVWEAAKLAFTGAFPDCDVTIDGKAYRTVSAVVCNGRHYGGPFVAAPQAAITDDLLHVVLMPGRGPWNIARYGVALLLGRLESLRDVRIVAGRSVEIRSAAPAPVQADGDVITQLPLVAAIDPDPVLLSYPE